MEHNDYDYDCVLWYGDRSPARNRKLFGGWRPVEERHRNFGGSVMNLNDIRCLVCNPYTETEEPALLGYEY